MKKLFLFTTVLFLQSCSCINKSFIPTGYEPSMLEKKGDSKLNIAIRPIKTIKLDFTKAINNKVGIRISPAGFIGFYSMDAGGFYYFSNKKLNIDLGGGFQYLKNFSHITDWGNFFPLSYEYYTQRFNISYYSPYFAGSIINKDEDGKFAFGFSMKASYNFIGEYNYYQVIDPYMGIGTHPYPIDDESTNEKPYPFFSVESALNFFFGKKRNIKIQLIYNYRYASLINHYSFYQNYGGWIQNTTEHPTCNLLALKIGFVIPLKKKN